MQKAVHIFSFVISNTANLTISFFLTRSSATNFGSCMMIPLVTGIRDRVTGPHDLSADARTDVQRLLQRQNYGNK